MDQTFGDRLTVAMKRRGLKNPAVAEALGVHEKSVSRWRGSAVATLDEPTMEKLAELLSVTPLWLRYGESGAPAVTPAGNGEWSPNPSLRRRLPPKAYAVVHGYLQTMADAKCSDEQIDEAERVMIDGAYNKLNSRDRKERSEDDMITDINAAWSFIVEVLGNNGIKIKKA